MKKATVFLAVVALLVASAAGSFAGKGAGGKGAVKVELKSGEDVVGFVVLNLNAKRTLIANVQLKDGEAETTYAVVIVLDAVATPAGELETDVDGEGGVNVHLATGVAPPATTVTVNVQLLLPGDPDPTVEAETGDQVLTFKK